jgi:hypothetical protein
MGCTCSMNSLMEIHVWFSLESSKRPRESCNFLLVFPLHFELQITFGYSLSKFLTQNIRNKSGSNIRNTKGEGFLIFTLDTLFDVKSSPATCHGGAWGERRYRSYSFTTSALDGGEWSASRPGRSLPPGKGPLVPIVEEAGWAPEPVWTQMIEEKSFALARDRTPIARSSSP